MVMLLGSADGYDGNDTKQFVWFKQVLRVWLALLCCLLVAGWAGVLTS
jgi:hypothetical protein